MTTIAQDIEALNPTAPRITPQHIKDVVAGDHYHLFPGTTLTVCCLILRNGFTVVGESACASPENFNRELGEKIARKNAEEKIWALEGYLLRQRLHETE